MYSPKEILARLSISLAACVILSGTALAQQPAEKAIPDKVRLFIPYKGLHGGG